MLRHEPHSESTRWEHPFRTRCHGGDFLRNSRFEQSEMLIIVYPNLLAKFIVQNRTKFQ